MPDSRTPALPHLRVQDGAHVAEQKQCREDQDARGIASRVVNRPWLSRARGRTRRSSRSVRASGGFQTPASAETHSRFADRYSRGQAVAPATPAPGRLCPQRRDSSGCNWHGRDASLLQPPPGRQDRTEARTRSISVGHACIGSTAGDFGSTVAAYSGRCQGRAGLPSIRQPRTIPFR